MDDTSTPTDNFNFSMLPLWDFFELVPIAFFDHMGFSPSKESVLAVKELARRSDELGH